MSLVSDEDRTLIGRYEAELRRLGCDRIMAAAIAMDILRFIAEARERENRECEAAIKCECSCCDRGRGAIAARRGK